MALTRLGIAYLPHYVFDTLDMSRRLYPTWPSHSLAHVAMRLNVASRAEHRALSDARLVKDIFLTMMQRTPTLKRISELMSVSQPLTFADAQVCTVEPPPGFEILTTAIAERCAITIVYERGSPRPGPRK
jgi:DNA polymerase III epsilon subunit-like protein